MKTPKEFYIEFENCNLTTSQEDGQYLTLGYAFTLMQEYAESYHQEKLKAETNPIFQKLKDKGLIDESYVAMDKVNEICDKAERDIELENKLIDFANWYLRLIKVTTDKDERFEIENREIIWSFLRGDDYKLWWNKIGKAEQSQEGEQQPERS